MPATITGIVFDDLNHNGIHDPGEPGIPNVFLTLFNTGTSACAQTATDANGIYSFSVTTAGTYRIYETVIPAAACPPDEFTQPTGFTLSNGPRVLSVTVTATQINNNATISGQNFSHDTIEDPLDCTTTLVQFVNTPTQWYNINVVTGTSTFEGLLLPSDDVNAISYNILDDYIYGYDQTTNHIVRVDNDRNLMQLVPNPTGLPSNGYNVGSFDLSGHLFIMVNNTARFYTVDLTPNSATFMKLVDPTNGFVEQTSNFGTALSTTLNVSDWAYNPNDGFLYGVRPTANSAQVMRVNPTTGAVTALTTTLPALSPTGNSWGAVAMDASGALFAIYNGNGGVFRFTISGTTAIGIRISTTFPTSFNDAAMCPAALVGPIADMSVVKTGAPSPVVPGEVETFTIVVTNNGPDAADNVTLVDAVSSQIENPECSLDGVTFFPWPGSLNLGAFTAGQTQTVLIRGTVALDTVEELPNTAIVGSDAQDPDPDNNTSTIVVPVAAVAADMAVVKTAAPDPVAPGDLLTYNVLVTNFGPDSAQSVTLTDVVPPELLGAEYSVNGGVTFLPWPGFLNLGTFIPGESLNVIIRGTVSPAATGTITNTAIVSSITPDPDPNNNISTVTVDVAETTADMAVVKTASPDPVQPGGTLTYSILVTNFGPDSAENVVLTDAVPATLLGAEYSVNGGVTFFPWTGFLNLGTFTPGESLNVIIRGTVSPSATGTISNTAVVSSTTPDPDPDNNTSTAVVIVGEAADMAVVKTADSTQVSPGGTITYTIVVTNFGPSDADNVLLTDVIPAGILGAEYSINGGVTFLPWPGFLNLGTFTPGETQTIIIRGTVSPSATGTLTNTAVVSSTTPDPEPDNNTSTVIVAICDARCQAITDLIESVALEEAALAHILNAEGEKLQRIIATPGVSPALLLQTNDSVRSLASAVTLLETILSSKLGLFEDCLCGMPQLPEGID